MSAPDHFAIVDRPSPNHGPRPPGVAVDILLLHYTGLPDAETALARLCCAAAEVSAHYTIDENGTIYHHVPEDRRAWHAGRGCWRGDRDVNSRSVGIELVNPGHEFGYRPFAPAQMAALVTLAQDIMGRHGITPDNVIGHSDIAPDRKEDPGELFDWPRLARHGIGLWPTPATSGATSVDDATVDGNDLRGLLTRYGYDEAVDLKTVLFAFQRHFHPENLTGRPYAETVRRLRALVRMAGR